MDEFSFLLLQSEQKLYLKSFSKNRIQYCIHSITRTGTKTKDSALLDQRGFKAEGVQYPGQLTKSVAAGMWNPFILRM